MEDTTANELEDLEYPEDEKLFKIAYWSKAVSWVVVILGIPAMVYSVYSTYIEIPESTLSNSIWLSSMLTSSFARLFEIAFNFFVLQAVGEILYLVIDIKERMRLGESQNVPQS